jgi:hypothetical protein
MALKRKTSKDFKMELKELNEKHGSLISQISSRAKQMVNAQPDIFVFGKIRSTDYYNNISKFHNNPEDYIMLISLIEDYNKKQERIYQKEIQFPNEN